MADEPTRRSGRATKGQHTQKLDLDTPEPTKKRASKKTKKVVEEEPEEVIRCVCGATDSPENDPEPWIACDYCGVWQHNVCVGVSTFDEDVPDNYLCEECDKVFHKELLDAMKQGRKLREERCKQFKGEQEEPKKKGKKEVERAMSSLMLAMLQMVARRHLQRHQLLS